VRAKLVIGFMGLATAGKTTACTFLQSLDPINIKILSFATPLKQAAKDLFMLSDEQLYGHLKAEIDPRWGVSPRTILQKMGTDFVREMIRKDFWVLRMRETIETCFEPVILIDDVRFEDEAKFVFCLGYTVNIDRLGLWSNDNHPSERPPVEYASDVLHNDLDLPHFHMKTMDTKAAQLVKERLQL